MNLNINTYHQQDQKKKNDTDLKLNYTPQHGY